MNLEDRNNEDIDMNEEYEMVPLEPMMYGYGQMNMMPNMGMQPDMPMYPFMGMQQGMGMYPCMGMQQFNEGMFVDGFNPMGMMYGDVPRNEDEDEGSRQLDKYPGMYPDMNQDKYKDPFKDGYNKPNKFNPKYNEVDSIIRRIERYNPEIFRLLTRYGIPYAEAKGIVRRIVRLTLMYSEG